MHFKVHLCIQQKLPTQGTGDIIKGLEQKFEDLNCSSAVIKT